MAAPRGNKNAAKGAWFRSALNRAIAQDDGERLRQAAEKLLTLAAQGEPWAVREIADRLDGRPAQQVLVDAAINRTPRDLTDAELAAIAAGAERGIADGADGGEGTA